MNSFHVIFFIITQALWFLHAEQYLGDFCAGYHILVKHLLHYLSTSGGVSQLLTLHSGGGFFAFLLLRASVRCGGALDFQHRPTQHWLSGVPYPGDAQTMYLLPLPRYHQAVALLSDWLMTQAWHTTIVLLLLLTTNADAVVKK
jgi:hypothetical protein